MVCISANVETSKNVIFVHEIITGHIKTRIAVQPIWDLQNMTLYGHEALARWQDLRSDEVFLAALKLDLVIKLEKLVLQRVGEDRDLISGPLFVNVHPSLPEPSLWECLKNRDVILEITEATAIRLEALDVLRDFGFALALDDIGTGAATLESLALIQPDFIKLDKSLTQSKNTKARNSLIKAFVDHATRLNAKVIVEGIETLEQLTATRETGAHYGQGYLLGKPQLLP